jgi:hypothetical protein
VSLNTVSVFEQPLPLFALDQTVPTSDDYLTPRWVFDTLGIGFDLDVASPPWATHVPAERIYTKADDGLAQPWSGRVWMNPPYSKSAPWVERFIAHADGIALLPWAKSAWTIRLWERADGIALPPRWFDFDNGGSIFLPVQFAAYGEECVDAISRVGHVRRLESPP